MYRTAAFSIFLCISMLLMFSCKKEDDTQTDNTEETNETDTTSKSTPELLFYLNASLSNGDSIVMNVFDIDTFDTYDIQGFATGIADADSCILSYTYGFTKFPILNAQNLPDDIFLFSFTRLFSSLADSCENAGEAQAYPDLFSPRSFNYVDDDEKKGITLIYKDTDGNQWGTIYGTQGNSNFEITDASEFDNSGISGVNMQIEGNFNAVLYSSDSSQSNIEITSAEYKVLFINAFN